MSVKGIVMFLRMNNTRFERKTLIILDYENGLLSTYLRQWTLSSWYVGRQIRSQGQRLDLFFRSVFKSAPSQLLNQSLIKNELFCGLWSLRKCNDFPLWFDIHAWKLTRNSIRMCPNYDLAQLGQRVSLLYTKVI